MAKVLTHVNGKGGTGKSTLNQLTAVLLSRAGKKVLMIDLDPNCCLSEIYGKESEKVRTTKDLILGRAVEPYNVAENLDLIPSDVELSFMNNFAETTVKNMLKKYYANKYDYIILDPPGTWSPLTRAAIIAATNIVVTGTLSNLDYNATVLFWGQLEIMCVEADITVTCNRSSNQKNEPGIFEKYKETFADFIYPQSIPDIKSLKLITSDPTYQIVPSVKKGLVEYVNAIIGDNQ